MSRIACTRIMALALVFARSPSRCRSRSSFPSGSRSRSRPCWRACLRAGRGAAEHRAILAASFGCERFTVERSRLPFLVRFSPLPSPSYSSDLRSSRTIVSRPGSSPTSTGARSCLYVSPPGSSLPETLAMLGRVDEVLSTTADVESFARRTGAEMGFFLTSANRGDYSIRLRRRADRRPIEEVIADVRGAS